MSKETTKSTLLEVGKQLFLERGYSNAGIEAILQTAGIPKGSFYYYFNSKEDFGLQVLDQFADVHLAELERYLADETLSPLERLSKYVESRCERLESRCCRNGCLIGNLSQEMADQSEAFRARLSEIFDKWTGRYAQCLADAQAAGEIDPSLDVQQLAQFWLNGWQGAILRAKTTRSTAPLRTFLSTILGFIRKK
jgi:TetR/AcrR family transcriptional repressor of nem operon